MSLMRQMIAATTLLWIAINVPAAAPEEAAAVDIQMRNVNLRIAPNVFLQIRRLRGRMIRTDRDQPVTLDKRDSFNVELESAEIAISTSSLSQLLNSYVFAYPNASLKNISVSIKGGRVIERGIMHKGVDLPFEVDGSIFATDSGIIRLHADKVRAEHVPMKGLLHLFGEDLSKLVNTNEARGARVEGDDILLFPSRMMPPPHILGRVTAVRIEGDNVVQVFGGKPPAPMRLPAPAANYIYHRGGVCVSESSQ